MTVRLTRTIVLSLSLLSLPASAEPECVPPGHLWDLELEKVERMSGEADLQDAASALGTRALMRGGYRDPAHSRSSIRAALVGSTDGLGLTISLQKAVP